MAAENARRAAEQRAKEEAAAAEVEAARRADEEELQRAVDLSLQLDKEGLLDVCRRRLMEAPEPEKVVRGETTTLRMQLPQGRRVERRFYAKDTLSLVRDFVVVASAEAGTDLAGKPFDLVMTLPPKRVFDTHNANSNDLKLNMREADLLPQATLFVTEVSA